jgi:glycosyltransferase involved in cell wall biosynthesis
MSCDRKMLVSIVTPTLNSARTIERTLHSVSVQSYKNVEHIIVDGGSTDNSLVLVGRWGGHKTLVVEDPGSSLYRAINMGIWRSAGSIISILNSDDEFKDGEVLSEIVPLFQGGADVVYGGIAYFSSKGNFGAQWIPSNFKFGSFQQGWHTPHPAFFVRASLYLQYGAFDESFRIAADFDLMLRFMENKSIRCVRVPRVLVNMQSDGTSSKVGNVIRGMTEIIASFKKNNIKIFIPWFVIKRYIPKIRRKLLNLVV